MFVWQFPIKLVYLLNSILILKAEFAKKIYLCESICTLAHFTLESLLLFCVSQEVHTFLTERIQLLMIFLHISDFNISA